MMRQFALFLLTSGPWLLLPQPAMAQVDLRAIVERTFDYLSPVFEEFGVSITPSGNSTISVSATRNTEPIQILSELIAEDVTVAIAPTGWSVADSMGAFGIVDPSLLDAGSGDFEERLAALTFTRLQSVDSIADSVLSVAGQNRVSLQQMDLAAHAAASSAYAEPQADELTAELETLLDPLSQQSIGLGSSAMGRTSTQDVLKDMAVQSTWRDQLLNAGFSGLGDKLDEIQATDRYYYPRAALQRAVANESLATIGSQLLDIQLSNSAALNLGLDQRSVANAERESTLFDRTQASDAAVQSAMNVYIPGLQR